MIKFKFTAERISEAADIPEYIGSLNGRMSSVLSLLPKMVIATEDVVIGEVRDKEGKVTFPGNIVLAGDYIVFVKHDEDGDITGFENLEYAENLMLHINPKRLTELSKELVTALGGVLNPPKENG